MPIHFAKSGDRSHPLCPHCGYDLFGTVSGRCPECGLSDQQIRILHRRELDRPCTRRDLLAAVIAQSTPVSYLLIVGSANRTCSLGYSILSMFRAMFFLSLLILTMVYFFGRYNSGRYKPWHVHAAAFLWVIAAADVSF